MKGQNIDIVGLISGDEKEVRRFARVSSTWVYNTIISYVQNEQDAEEITQDTVLAALNGIQKFKKESALKTWMFSIAINKCRDHIKYKNRKKRSGKVISLYASNESGEQNLAKDFVHPGIALESKEQMNLLFNAINQLSENQKTALILAKLEQKPQKEIAVVMNLSVKAVESLISRAKQGLKLILEKEGLIILKKFK